MILKTRDTKNSAGKLLEIIKNFSTVAKNQLTKTYRLPKEITDIRPFIIKSKTIKYPGISQTKEIKRLT